MFILLHSTEAIHDIVNKDISGHEFQKILTILTPTVFWHDFGTILRMSMRYTKSLWAGLVAMKNLAMHRYSFSSLFGNKKHNHVIGIESKKFNKLWFM